MTVEDWLLEISYFNFCLLRIEMTFVESIKTCLAKKFFSFQGRASRSEYWWFTLFNFVAGLILNFIPVVGNILSFVLLFPAWAVAVRRCHDLNKTGWLILLPSTLLILGIIILVCGMAGSEGLLWSGSILLILGSIAGLALTIYFIFPGTQGPNKYGDGPYVYTDANANQQ